MCLRWFGLPLAPCVNYWTRPCRQSHQRGLYLLDTPLLRSTDFDPGGHGLQLADEPVGGKTEMIGTYSPAAWAIMVKNKSDVIGSEVLTHTWEIFEPLPVVLISSEQLALRRAVLSLPGGVIDGQPLVAAAVAARSAFRPNISIRRRAAPLISPPVPWHRRAWRCQTVMVVEHSLTQFLFMRADEPSFGYSATLLAEAARRGSSRQLLAPGVGE